MFPPPVTTPPSQPSRYWGDSLGSYCYLASRWSLCNIMFAAIVGRLRPKGGRTINQEATGRDGKLPSSPIWVCMLLARPDNIAVTRVSSAIDIVDIRENRSSDGVGGMVHLLVVIDTTCTYPLTSPRSASGCW